MSLGRPVLARFYGGPIHESSRYVPDTVWQEELRVLDNEALARAAPTDPVPLRVHRYLRSEDRLRDGSLEFLYVGESGTEPAR